MPIRTSRSRDAFRSGLRLLRRFWWIGLVVAVSAVTAAAVSLKQPTTFQSSAVITMSGRETGSPEGDANQAKKAIAAEPLLAVRARHTLGLGAALTVVQFQHAVEQRTSAQGGTLELVVVRPTAADVALLCQAYAPRLATDQLAQAVTSCTYAVKVGPPVVRNAFFGACAGFLVGLLLALVSVALADRRATAGARAFAA